MGDFSELPGDLPCLTKLAIDARYMNVAALDLMVSPYRDKLEVLHILNRDWILGEGWAFLQQFSCLKEVALEYPEKDYKRVIGTIALSIIQSIGIDYCSVLLGDNCVREEISVEADAPFL